MSDTIHNPRLQTLALRLLGRHFPESMTQTQADQFSAYLSKMNNESIVDYQGKPRLSATAALYEITDLRKKSLEPAQMLLLDALEDYLEEKILNTHARRDGR
jgi:exonuclease I